jgi:RimJ/RimL family protein N-acetyltransferase
MEFQLRPWRKSDLEDLVHFANNFNISRNLTNKFPYPYTRVAGENFIAFASQHEPPNIMAIIIEGRASGGIGIHPLHDIESKNAEMGYWLAEDFWGNGIITQAIIQMVDYSFQHFEINRIFARPFGSNKASQRVLEKAGFTLEARLEKTLYKNDQYEDELIYAMRRKNYR